ncbi:MAG: hypothetical protein FWD41_00405 [Actinomycetia bacterium]|nr:hypothetical protein [Actinomycetes bacterium]
MAGTIEPDAGNTSVEVCNALLEIQKLDLVLDELAVQEASFPHKAQVAQIAQKAAEGQSLIAKLEEGVVQFDKQIAAIADTIAHHEKKIAKEQKKLDAGKIDFRQVDALSSDIASHHDQIKEAEGKQLNLMEARQEAKRRITDVGDKIAELEGAKEQTLAAYRQQMAILAAKTVQITTARDEKRSILPPDLATHYDTLRAQKGGTVVGVFDGSRCSACSLKLPSAFADEFHYPGDVGTCSECRRILVYWGDDHDE